MGCHVAVRPRDVISEHGREQGGVPGRDTSLGDTCDSARHVAGEQPEQQVPVAGGQPRSDGSGRGGAKRVGFAAHRRLRTIGCRAHRQPAVSYGDAEPDAERDTRATPLTAAPARPLDARRARRTGDAPARHCPCEPARAARRRSAPPSRRRARCGSPSGSAAGHLPDPAVAEALIVASDARDARPLDQVEAEVHRRAAPGTGRSEVTRDRRATMPTRVSPATPFRAHSAQ